TVACALGTGPVYLVGHDLGKNPEASHWNGADYAGNDWQRKACGHNSCAAVAGSGYERRWVPANGGGMVESIAWWYRFRDEIAHEALMMRSQNRVLYNLNAHYKRYAHISHCGAAPLPDPAELEPLPPIQLPPSRPERLHEWRERARQLPDDCDRYREHLKELLRRIDGMRSGPPGQWEAQAIADALNDQEMISIGNRMAFGYFLRSAVHNSNADMHLRRRTPNAARSRWAMLESMRNLCTALDNALATLRPQIDEVADA
ncbi:MAG: hypothetical protein ACOCXA_05800, partial [Planctomycetota bacterium]